MSFIRLPLPRVAPVIIILILSGVSGALSAQSHMAARAHISSTANTQHNSPMAPSQATEHTQDNLSCRLDPIAFCHGLGFGIGGSPDERGSFAEGQFIGADAYYLLAKSAGGSTTSWAVWYMNVPIAGRWEIFAYVPSGNMGRSSTTRAVYELFGTTRELSHDVASGWYSLGQYDLVASDGSVPANSVTLRNGTSDWQDETGARRVVMVDALRAVYRSEVGTPGPTSSATPRVGSLIVDDRDSWRDQPTNCGIVAHPLPSGTGFFTGGSPRGWYSGGLPASGSSIVWKAHAHYTHAKGQWRNHDENNWAIWAPSLPANGRYRIEAFVPRMGTGSSFDTRRATYQIRHSFDQFEWDHEVVIDQLSNVGTWVSLGTYEFTNTDAPGGCGGGPTVMLSDVSSDIPSAVTFDAVRWVNSELTEPAAISVYLRDIPEGAHVQRGERVTHCFSVSRPAHIRWWWYNPSQGWSLSRELDDDGRGMCDTSDALEEVGIRRIKIEIYERGQVLASDETHFYVDVSAPTASLSPTPRDTTVPSRTPPVPGPTPRPTDRPSGLSPIVIVPGYGHSIPLLPSSLRMPNRELDALETALLARGLFVIQCAYDWTKSNATSALSLRNCVTTALSASTTGRVSIVTHSNGALVARAYIQDPSFVAPVDRLYMIAPPNQGSVFAYNVWEGGQLNGLSDIFGKEANRYKRVVNAYVALKASDFACKLILDDKCRFDVFQKHVPSLRELLPVGEAYLRNVDTGALVPPSSMVERNDFLNQLNLTVDQLFAETNYVHVAVGTGKDTPYRLSVKPTIRRDGMWKDGEPASDVIARSTSGDGLILESRATTSELLPHAQVWQADHGSVIAEAKEVILQDLGFSTMRQAATLDQSAEDSEQPWVIASSASARLLLTDAHGRRSGRNATGQIFNEIPEAQYGEATDSTYSMILLPSAPTAPLTLQLASIRDVQQQYHATVISGNSGDAVWGRRGTISHGETVTLTYDPAAPTPSPSTTSLNYLPVLLFGSSFSPPPRPSASATRGTSTATATVVATTPAATRQPTNTATRQPTATSVASGRIVYTRAVPGLQWDLFTSDPDGGNEVRLTNTDDRALRGNARGEEQPRWSADGSQIAFTTVHGAGERTTIWRMPASGGTPLVLAGDFPGTGDPAWQRPSGDCIVYSEGQINGIDPVWDLYIKCPNGTNRQLTDSSGIDESNPDWSPNGAQIAYEAREGPRTETETRQVDLWVINADGTGRRRLLSAPETSERHPRWSPDGGRIAFISYEYKSGYGKGRLKVLDVASGALTDLVDGAAGPAAWSPDGSTLMFHNLLDDGPRLPTFGPAQVQASGLYTIDVLTRTIMRLKPPAGGSQASRTSFEWGYSPDWSQNDISP